MRHGSGLLALVARHIATAAGKGGIRPYPAIDAKTVIYAVGDVHGRADLLMRVHEAMEKDWRARPAERRLEVYLGDYVDRGPDSASVIAMLRARSRTSRIMPLLGNHEEVLLRFLDGRLSDREWLDWGGAATALSYGINPSREAILNAALSRAIPLDDIRFLRALRPSFRYGPYFFAHAGVLPNRALEDQGRDDLLWIRRPFLDHKGNFGAVVVHGHTPNAEPEFKSNRINLDTGAYATHRLSCLRIDATGAALIGG
ncbi:MAG: metallophosphoesterase [Pseudomonadota bacterium]|nr:metallophosphoesterase [Pseudomonadota bacterium]